MKYLVKFTNSKMENIILNVCIFLFGINFLYKCNYIVIATFLLLLIFKKFRINYGNLKTLIILLLFSISWYVFSDGHEIAGLCLPVCYLIGNNIDESDEKGLTKFILLVSISLAVYTTTFFFNNAMVNGITSYDVYYQPNIWTGRPLWATNIMMFSSLFYSCFGLVVFSKIDYRFKIVYFIIFAINAFYALMLSRRAALLMVALSAIVSFIYKLIFSEKEEKKILIKIALIAISIGVIIVVIIVTFYIFNIFGFNDMVKNTDLYIRFISDENVLMIFNDMGRSYIRSNFMKYFWDYPWGGSHIHKLIGNYSHDLWLDVYDVAGIIPMILIIIFTIMMLDKVVKVVCNKEINIDYKMLVFSLFICVLAQCCIEPVMEACRAYMFGVCMIFGSVDKISSANTN